MGSSPPTWGIPGEYHPHLHCIRFIPTYVGHTPDGRASIRCPSVHPHLRGAYVVGDIGNHQLRGSSPPTWGIRWRAVSMRPCHPVHPHLRGAYFAAKRAVRLINGSSPPTWGILTTPRRRVFCFTVHPHLRGAYRVEPVGSYHVARFIPTYVGHTILVHHSIANNPVHPHLRGAYIARGGDAGRVGGSSPPTWGIQRS